MIPDRFVWSDEDFDQMGWHDATVHAVAFQQGDQPWLGTLLLDIDYILEWVHPGPGETHYQFWVAPATLAFEAVSSLNGELDIQSLPPSLDTVRRELADRPEATAQGYEKWVLAGHDFEWAFNSRGFRQVFRRPPFLSPKQRLELDQRGGISFALETIT